MAIGAEGSRWPEPYYLASGAACPCARRPRRLGSPSRPGPAPGTLAVWPRIQTAWCSPPLPRGSHPPSLLPGLAAAATRGSGRGERAEAGARRQLLTLGVAEVSPRGSRLRSAEQRRRLPRAEPLGPQEEPEEEEEDWGSAARPHNVQGAGRRRRGTCAPRRAGRPVLPGIAERLLEWGAGGAEAGGPRVLRRSNTPGARLWEERGGESEASGDRLLLDGVPSSAARACLAAGRGLQETEVRGARSSGARRSRSPPPRADRLF